MLPAPPPTSCWLHVVSALLVGGVSPLPLLLAVRNKHVLLVRGYPSLPLLLDVRKGERCLSASYLTITAVSVSTGPSLLIRGDAFVGSPVSSTGARKMYLYLMPC